jgi:hypothetical protein
MIEKSWSERLMTEKGEAYDQSRRNVSTMFPLAHDRLEKKGDTYSQ